MKVVVCYDVAREGGGAKRWSKVAKICEDYGERVQYSVFECIVNPAQLVEMKARLNRSIDSRCDSVRYYHLGKHWENKVEHVGAKEALDLSSDVFLF